MKCCKNCGRRLSGREKYCPQCGNGITGKRINISVRARLLGVCVCLLLLAVFSISNFVLKMSTRPIESQAEFGEVFNEKAVAEEEKDETSAIAGAAAGVLKKDAGADDGDKENEAIPGFETEVFTGNVKYLLNTEDGMITLGAYKEIVLVRTPVFVSDSELNQAVQEDLSANAKIIWADRPARQGDIVNIDYTGSMGGRTFDGGTAEDCDLTIGSGQFISGFEDGLVGRKKGDRVTLNLAFPAEYPNSDFAGKAVVFDVIVNAVSEKQIPELDDAFVRTYTSFRTVSEYKADKKGKVLQRKKEQSDQTLINDAYNSILNASKVEPRQEAVDARFRNILDTYVNQATAYGMDLKTFANSVSRMSEEDFKGTLKNQALETIKQRLVINAIAETEGIVVTDEERRETADKMGYESAEKMIEASGQSAVDEYILSKKVMDFVVSHAMIR